MGRDTMGYRDAGRIAAVVVALAGVLALALSVGLGRTGTVVPQLPALSHEGFSAPCGTATDSQGNLYIADYTEDKISVFDASGTPITSFTPSANGENPCSLAVDSAGSVYIDGWGFDVVKYKPEGAGFPPTPSTTYGADTAINGNGVLTEGFASSVAVNPANDHVYVVEEGERVSEYLPNGTAVSATIGAGVAPGHAYYGVDVYGKTGDVYLTDLANDKAYVLNPAGTTILTEIDGTNTPTGAFDFAPFIGLSFLAVDQQTGNVLVSDIWAHNVVDEFDTEGNYLTTISHSPAFSDAAPSDIAVDGSKTSPNKGNVYVSSGNGHAEAFGALPSAGLELKVKKEGPGTGTVTSSPAGIDCGTTCAVFFPEGEEVTLTAVPDPPDKVRKWSGCDSVAGDECTVTTEAAREVSVSFTAPPAIGGEEASQITSSSAVLKAEVNPNGEASTYQFEYLSKAAFEANGNSFSGPAVPAKVPASPASIGTGSAPVPVPEQITGLEAETAYRFRVLATNATGTSTGEAKAFATFPSQGSTGQCPGNQAFREAGSPSVALPDCRAYEQASPVDKNVGNPQGTVTSVKAAAQGAAITFESAAGMPGGEGSQDFPTYLASRGVGGWSTQGLLPPASEGQGGSVLGWTPDFSQVFSSADKFGVGVELLERPTAGGVQAAVVPYTQPGPRYSFAGSSSTGDKVLFEADASIALAADSAVPVNPDVRNLYAWDRGNDERRLVGVLPDGTAPSGGSLTGEDGGENYLQDSYAISTGAQSAFFTAPEPGKTVGQLFLRQNPTSEETDSEDSEGNCVPDPTLACTLHVSSSEKTNGGGLDGTDAAGRQPAAFMAASSDGSVAFFTSSEKLTNDANTGSEPQPAAIAEANLGDGSGVDLGFLPTRARGVEVVGNHVYWADPGGEGAGEGVIGRAKLGGSEPEDVEPDYVTGLFNPRRVAVDLQHLYWTEAHEGEGGEGTVGRAKIGAIEAEEIEPNCITGASGPEGIAVDATYVYWANAKLVSGAGNGLVGRANITGSCAASSSSAEQEFIPFARGDIAVTATKIYFSRADLAGEHPDGFIRRYNIDGSVDPTWAGDITVSVAGEAPAIALDGSHLYWANSGESKIGRSDLDGGSQIPGFIAAAAHPRGVAVDASHIYWSANQEVQPNPGNDLYRYQVQSDSVGHHLADVAVDTTNPDGMEVQGVLGVSADASYVYYAANGVPDGGVANSPNANGESAVTGDCNGPLGFNSGTCNLYLWHEGQTSFIARLSASGGEFGDFSNWVPRPSVNNTFSKYQKTARVTSEGGTLFFRSRRQLTAYDNKGQPQFYRYLAGSTGATCVTCNPTGAPPTGPVKLGSMNVPRVGAGSPALVLSRNMSADGKRFFFESRDALVAADTNGENGCPLVGSEIQRDPVCQDVYEWEAKGVGSCESEAQNGGCISLLSTGKSKEPSFFGDADEAGGNAFIFTTEQLVPGDVDTLLDAYDVRVGGGLTSQHQVELPPCQGEGCSPAPTPPPTANSPGSNAFSGPGSPAQARSQHHAKKKKKKKHKHHRAKHGGHRAAKTNGRAGR